MLLSLCMIVKNEQDVLERCLESVKSAVDEIIIIDTGSTDRTKAIALSYQARIYEYAWSNDFSAARNEGVKRAAGKWILVMDADEYFAAGDAEKLRQFLEMTEPSPHLIYSINVINFVGKSMEQASITSGEIPRLFPNGYGIEYYRPIHEQLRSESGELLSSLAPVSLFHTGYLEEMVNSKAKLDRNAGIFKELKEKQGFTAYDYYTLGNECAVGKDFQKAVYYYERAIKKQNKLINSSWFPHCVISLIHSYLVQNRMFDAWKLTEEKLSAWKDYPEYAFYKAAILHHLGFMEEAEMAYIQTIETAAIKSRESQVFWLESAEYATTIPMRKLSSIYEWQKKWSDSVHYLTKLLMQDLYDYSALRALLKIMTRFETVEATIQLLDKLYEPDNSKHRYILFRSALANHAEELSRHYYESIADDLALSIEDKLEYFFLVKDKKEYEKTIALIPSGFTQERLARIHALASRAWGLTLEPPLAIEDTEEQNQAAHRIEAIRSYLGGDTEAEDVTEENAGPLLDLLKDSFHLGEFSIYDQLINRYSHDFVIQHMADYMFAQEQTEIALSYYSLLLDQNALNGKNMENLAIHHLHQNLVENGLAFLEEAIRELPGQIYLYVLYLKNAVDLRKKEEYRQKLLAQFPGARKLPIFTDLLTR
ncbi:MULTISPECIES: glycosyltransferase family 2 protein [unclassified Paenibacillus]|uniref:glycosyltransferase family 2 protein n=1 Tax=unclassified Paenibacillus TaxID=185978 RepID=UPI000953E9B5|nr:MULTISPECIES: glycosyltransferase family 2 protein [unclassified Paenibacillus]ASS67226.2 glycosyltransferase family 2 protein [Paenibacillus sp. RUD330]SIQ85070.1 Glycosyl transferase family 2 [Paenibacillus sp. RU4X]SIR05874.1 Glycosyl transferase family 2 [Paenibacillus sp. RU4T]